MPEVEEHWPGMWDMDLVTRVVDLEATWQTSYTAVATAGIDPATMARERLAGQLIAAALEISATVHPGDVHVRRLSGDDATALLYAATWSPGWATGKVDIELFGGAQDGNVLSIDAGLASQGIHLPTSPDFSRRAQDPVTVATQRYEAYGWRGRERRWVMRLTEGR